MALREINLVPAEILDRLHFFRHLYLWAGLLIISLCLIFGFHLYQTRVILAKKRAATGLTDIRTNLNSRIEEIKRIQENLENIHQRKSVLLIITGNKPFSKILVKLADILNEYTWLTQLAISGGKRGDTSLKLTGFSFSNEELGDFLNQVSREVEFKSVVLKYARETQMTLPEQMGGEPVKVIQFQIDCKISRV